MKLLTLAAAVGLVIGIRHFLGSRRPSPRVRPIIGQLAKRVREVVEFPDNVDVTSREGIVTLKGGPMPKDEVDRALAGVLAVPGVHEVRNYVQLTS